MIKAARTLKAHLSNIVTYAKHQIATEQPSTVIAAALTFIPNARHSLHR